MMLSLSWILSIRTSVPCRSLRVVLCLVISLCSSVWFVFLSPFDWGPSLRKEMTMSTEGNDNVQDVEHFFFAKTVKKDVSKSSHKNAPSELRAQVTGVANHLGRGRRGPVRAKAAPTLQQRQCERLGSAASQDGRPPECPHLLGPTAEDWRHPSRFGLGQLVDKLGGFIRPPASHFGAQDNQSGAAIAPMELRVRGLFATPCCVQGCTVHVGASRVRGPIPAQWRDQCRVHGELGTMEERQAVNHDFDPAVVQGIRRCQVHVLDSDVRGHTAACFPANPRCGRLQCETP